MTNSIPREDEMDQGIDIVVSEDFAEESDMSLQPTIFLQFLQQIIDRIKQIIEVMWHITGVSVPMAFSYTLSFTVVLFLFLLSPLIGSAAASLVSIAVNITMVLGVAPLLSGSPRVSGPKGAIRDLKKSAKEDNISIIAASSIEEGNINSEKIKMVGNGLTIEENRALINAVLRNNFIAAIPLAVLMSGVFFFAENIFIALGQDPQLAKLAGKPLKIYSAAPFGITLRISEEQTLFGLGRQKKVMAIALTDFALCTAFALWKSDSLEEIMGAYVFESYFTSSLYFLLLMLSPGLKKYSFFNFFQSIKGSWNDFKALCRIGGGITFALFNQLFLTIATTLFVGLSDDIEQESVWSVLLALLSFFLILIAAYGQGCMQEVSREIAGANALVKAMHAKGNDDFIGDYRAASDMGIWGFIASLFLIVPLLTFFAFYPQILATLLGLDEEASAMLTILVPIISVGILASAVVFILIQQLRILGRDITATLPPFLMTLIGVPAAWLLGVKIPSLTNEISVDMGMSLAYTVVALMAASVIVPWAKEIRPKQIQARNEIKDVKDEIENERKLLNQSSSWLPAIFQNAPEGRGLKKTPSEEKYILGSNNLESKLPKQSSSWWPSNWCPGTFRKARPDQQLLPVSSFVPT